MSIKDVILRLFSTNWDWPVSISWDENDEAISVQIHIRKGNK